MNFKELKQFYFDHFGLGYLNPSPDEKTTTFEKRLILISLVCYITHKTKLKHPDTTHYSVLMKLSQNLGLPDDFIKGLAIVCEDFSYCCEDFPVFGLKGQEIVKEVISILNSYTPF